MVLDFNFSQDEIYSFLYQRGYSIEIIKTVRIEASYHNQFTSHKFSYTIAFKDEKFVFEKDKEYDYNDVVIMEFMTVFKNELKKSLLKLN